MLRRGLVLGLLTLLALVLAALLTQTNRRLRDGELLLYDWHLRALPRRAPDPRIVIVGMEDATPSRLPDLETPYYPLPRTYHARLVDQLRQAGARVIAFDILFPQPRAGDAAFAAALQRHGNVLAGLTPQTRLDEGTEWATFTPPTPALATHLLSGSILVPRSFGNQVRWIEALRRDDARPEHQWPHLTVAAVAAFFDESSATPSLTNTFHWGTHQEAPVIDTEQGTLPIRYIGPAGSFSSVPYEEVYTGAWRQRGPAVFRDKLVLVGRMNRSVPHEDWHFTPLGEMAGTELLANTIQMSLQGDYIRQAPPLTGVLVGAVLALLFVLVLWRAALLPALGTLLLLAIGWPLLAHGLFRSQQLWLPSLAPLVSLLGAALLTVPYEVLRTRRAVGRLLSASAARSAWLGGDQLGMRAVEVSVVFCDIRGFTPFCETHTPEEVEALLQAYFDAGYRAARRNGTELDKFMGDAIMLYFFEEKGKQPSAVRAVRWAQAMQVAAAQLGIRVGIGIATGSAREGFIGARGLMQRTVIGDVVNLAARLQEATKQLDTPILLSEGSFAQLGGAAEPLGEITVRGKQMPVRVFRPTAEEKKS